MLKSWILWGNTYKRRKTGMVYILRLRNKVGYAAEVPEKYVIRVQRKDYIILGQHYDLAIQCIVVSRVTWQHFTITDYH